MKRILSAVLCAVLLLTLMPVLPRAVSAEGLSHFDIRLTEPVASYSPDFSAEFNTGAQFYTTVTWQEDSPGFSAKLGSSDEFKAGLAYKAVIWVRFGDGNYLATNANGDLDAALTVNGKAISSLKIEDRDSQGRINEVTITCKYDPLPGRELSSVMIKNVPTPVAGNMPGYSFTIEGSSYGFYPTEPIVWRDKTDNFKQLDSSDTFIQGHQYQLCIWLYANREGGFTFKTDQYGNPQVNATINSWAADKVNKAYEQEGREVIEILYTFPACQAAHTCDPKLVPLQEQTCLMPGFKAYYECSCGKCYEDAAGTKLVTDTNGYGIIPADGHTPSDWRITGAYHYKACTTCGDFLEQEDHFGGTATCIAQAKCSACGAAYGNTASEHKWSPTYLYKDAKGHAWVCADCKGHSEVVAHKPGPEATETTPQKCTECGYIITPAKSHTHELTLLPGVEPTCLASGTVAHYACSGCTALFSDAEGKNPLPADTEVIIPPLGHTISENWSFDAEYHWRTCTTCREVLSETQMLHDAAKCATCGYTVGEEIVPTEPEPTHDHIEKQEDAPADFSPWIIAIVVGVLCFGVGIGAAVLILRKKKQ